VVECVEVLPRSMGTAANRSMLLAFSSKFSYHEVLQPQAAPALHCGCRELLLRIAPTLNCSHLELLLPRTASC
jgi:hypothetical protein